MPSNLGFPINTFKSENSLIVSKDGKTAYYSSDRSGFGKEDIFTFQLPKMMQALKVSELEIDILTSNRGEEIILNNVSFSSNSIYLDDSSYVYLESLITYLKRNPELKIEIQGHTDNIGNEDDNLILSIQRAKVVFDYLSKNINNQLTYKGFGESQPISKDNAKNRRTSFIILE